MKIYITIETDEGENLAEITAGSVDIAVDKMYQWERKHNGNVEH